MNTFIVATTVGCVPVCEVLSRSFKQHTPRGYELAFIADYSPGTALQPFNGRDALRDLYEELLDACTYIRQVIEERDSPLTEPPATEAAR